MSIRVAVVEDSREFRESLSALLSREGFAVVAMAANIAEARRNVARAEPEVILLDIHLPDGSGVEYTRDLARATKASIVMLTIEGDASAVFDSLAAGASGYLLKTATGEAIVEAVRESKRGGSPISPQVARFLVRTFQKPGGSEASSLTVREREILDLVAKGYRTKEIAHALNIAEPTVNTHVRNIYEKLHVRSRAEAVVKFLGSRQ